MTVRFLGIGSWFGLAEDRWRAVDPIDGQARTIVRRDFSNQAEQIAYLRKMVAAYRGTQQIRALARDIVFRQFQCAPKKKACHALAIGTWVQQNVTYVNEGDETFQTPIETLRAGFGDCDDFTTTIAALLESLGIPSELVGVEWGGHALPFGVWLGGSFRHIFPRAIVAGRDGKPRRIPLDATLDAPISRLTDPVRLAAARGVRPRTLAL